MKWELIKIELKVNYELWMNIHMNELHLSCENDVYDIEWFGNSIKKFVIQVSIQNYSINNIESNNVLLFVQL
jgi:hypothetical protein